jgi:phospholipid-binding lipoprotein MlaA
VKHITRKFLLKPATALLSLVGVLGLSACSSTSHPYDPDDPLQTLNRGTFAFNQQFDRFLLKPVAQGYKAVTPAPVRTGVNNFFWNLNEIPTTANYLLQAQPGPAYVSFWRLLINSTVGIGGLFDVATHMGLPRTTNDFGITLSKWGFSSAPYFVVPFLGPSNIRDGLGLLTDYEFFTVWPYMKDVALRNSLLTLDMIRIRANLLDNEPVLDNASFDKYTMIRDAYVQYRYQLIQQHGGQYDQGAHLTYSTSDEDFALGVGNDAGAGLALGIPTTPEAMATYKQAKTPVKSGATQTTAPASTKATSGSSKN